MAMKYSQKRMIAALYKSGGIIAKAADILGCTRQTVYAHIKKYPAVEAAFEDANETALDYTESKLLQNVKAGKESSIFFHLNNKGRDRGYGKPLLIAPTDPTGTKEYGADARNAILGKLLPELALGDEKE